jgi:hypothetical protein
MDQVLADIQAFVSGEMSAAEFRTRLYAGGGFDEFLQNDPRLPPDGYVVGSVYQFLLEQDFDDPGDIYSAQGALIEFMDRNGITYTATKKYGQFYDLILKAQPRWIDVPAKYIQEKMLPDAPHAEGKQLQVWLTEEFRNRFRFVKKPPKWIQSANWPINENGPLVFLGQFDVNNYFHDAAAVYVFHDAKTGVCKTIIQVY